MTPAFFTLHSGLQREAPGEAAVLDWALVLAGTAADARVLDAGCGPGADTALLRDRLPAAQITAVDLHPPFVAQVTAAHQGDAGLRAEVADMLDPPGGPFDLIWSNGAAYGPGVDTALAAWAGRLAPGGRVALTDCVWRGTTRPAAAADYWAADYPQMTDEPGLVARIAAAGWRVLGSRWLSDAAWRAYYDPLQCRVDSLRPGADAGMVAVLDETQREIDMWRQHGAAWGYLCLVMEPAG